MNALHVPFAYYESYINPDDFAFNINIFSIKFTIENVSFGAGRLYHHAEHEYYAS